SPFSSLTSKMPTLTPFSARARPVAAPSPDAPPVIIAVNPSNFIPVPFISIPSDGDLVIAAMSLAWLPSSARARRSFIEGRGASGRDGAQGANMAASVALGKGKTLSSHRRSEIRDSCLFSAAQQLPWSKSNDNRTTGEGKMNGATNFNLPEDLLNYLK